MKALILNGSPRVSGDTESLIKLLVSGIEGAAILVGGGMEARLSIHQ